MQQQSFRFSLGIILIIVFVLSSVGLYSTQWASGYGYSGTCSADAPENISVHVKKKLKIHRLQRDKKTGEIKKTVQKKSPRGLLFKWDAVEFENCADEVADHYVLQILDTDDNIVRAYTPSKNQYRVAVNTLPSNQSLQVRVRAIATDDAKTDFSETIPFRTPPHRPNKLTIEEITNTSAHVSWNNSIRSDELEYYRIVVLDKKTPILQLEVNDQLDQAETHMDLRELVPGTVYTVQVRAVASKNRKSAFRIRSFRTLAE